MAFGFITKIAGSTKAAAAAPWLETIAPPWLLGIIIGGVVFGLGGALALNPFDTAYCVAKQQAPAVMAAIKERECDISSVLPGVHMALAMRDYVAATQAGSDDYGCAEEFMEPVVEISALATQVGQWLGAYDGLGMSVCTPTVGSISSPFGCRRLGPARLDPRCPVGQSFHEGVDYRAPCGTPIVAARGGEVTRIGYQHDGYGYWVEIRHPNGTITRYGHLIAPPPNSIREGTVVLGGELIGQVGNTGRSTGCHLHFEVRRADNGDDGQGTPLNPLQYVRDGACE